MIKIIGVSAFFYILRVEHHTQNNAVRIRGVYTGGDGSSHFQPELGGDKISPSSLNFFWIK